MMENTTHFEQSNLTHGQQLMWLGQKLQPKVPLYNMSHTHTIQGAFDTAIFQQAFSAFTQASDNFRTVVREIEDSPQAIVLNTIDDTVEIIDFSALANPQVSFEQWLDSRRAQIINIEEKLFDTAIIKLSATEHVWYFGQHHFMTDGISVVLAYTHISNLYRQLADNQAIELPNLPDYSAYKAHEQAIRNTDAYQKAQHYWQTQLNKPSEPIPFYATGNAKGSVRTERIPVELGAKRIEKLEQLSQHKGFRSFSKDMTYSNIFASLIFAYMYHISQNETLRLGTPFANRSTPDFQQTLGLFIEVLSLTVDIQADDNFQTLVKKVGASNFGALQHLQAGIGTAEHNRAYDVLMNFVTGTFPDFAGLSTKTYWVHSGYGDDNHKIRIQIHDMNQDGHFGLYFDFNMGIFSPVERDLAIEHFLRVMDACLDNPEIALSDISLLAVEEEQTHLIDFNTSNHPYPADKTVIALFEEQAQKTPDAIAVSMNDDSLTYADLNAYANGLAQTLSEKGVQAETLVPVCLDHTLMMVVTLLGILKAGGAYVPIDPNHPDERIAYLLDDVGEVPLVITHGQHTERFDNFAGTILTVDEFPTAIHENPQLMATTDNIAYVIYTSGSTGQPKGVLVQHSGLTNYVCWAQEQYTDNKPTTFALYSSLAFDLTVTSIYVPLISGGTVRVYQETGTRGMVIRDVFADNAVDVVKLTPSHLSLIREMDLANSRISKLIVGGEDFKIELAQAIHRLSNGKIKQLNEYGPTEATVACLLHEYSPAKDTRASVPIGTPSHNMRVYILDKHLQASPIGVVGELYLSGVGVARGYLNRDDLTKERFLTDPFDPSRRMYKTGDLARWLPTTGQLEFLGRADRQVKVGGARIELGEIESVLLSHPAIQSVALDVRTPLSAPVIEQTDNLDYCERCGLASNFPGITFDAEGICSICRSYEGYKEKAHAYFKDMQELEAIVDKIKATSTGDYDCIALLSGGKDSSYMVYRLAEMGLRVLTFTLDNGYISDEAIANTKRITKTLDVEHVFGETPFMNSIFADSLRRYANVCNGCFKTIYTMAVNLAREKGINTIVTGLSRGQFFETRLTEEVFEQDDFDVQAIDESIARARRAYHQRDDIISRSLDVDVFRNETVYEDIQFVDFYRYCDVDLTEIYDFLDNHAPWIRPADTGRSTNCLINDVGIYVHKKRRGFHSYALPYSWDVRMGHKTREEAMDELDDEIDESRVKRIMQEIGYHDLLDTQAGDERLVAYYLADTELSTTDLRDFLGNQLPDFMIPSYFVALNEMPLSTNGKVNYSALPDVTAGRVGVAVAYAPPENSVQEDLLAIWQTVMNIERIGIHDNFFDLGGHSLPAIRISSRINAQYDIDLPLDVFFANPTIASLAIAIEDILMAEIDDLSEEELLRLLEEDADE